MQTIQIFKNDIYKGHLILVNQDYPIVSPISFNEMVTVMDQKIHRDVGRLLLKIFDDLQCHQEIICTSGYRSSNEQSVLYESSLKDYGQEYTQKYVALPHCSEHETGLAVDMAYYQESIDKICPEFFYDGICQEFRDLSYHYGFIERYSEYKQHITHIGKEPWHFRYVGYPHSCIMKEENLCLEEYHEFIKQYSLYHPYIYGDTHHIIEIFYVPIYDQETLCFQDDVCIQVSGNNMDGVIITAWRTCL